MSGPLKSSRSQAGFQRTQGNLNPMRLIGAHMPTGGGGIPRAITEGHEIGCTAVQVFTSSPRQWAGKHPTPDLIAETARAVAQTRMGFVCSHDTYLVNLCAPDDETRRKSIKCLTEEVKRCSALSIPVVVSHIGSHKGEGEEKGLVGCAGSLVEVLAETPHDVCIAMETTAGQGSALGYRFEHWAMIIEAHKGDPRLGICLDTCHIFAAGYDIRTPEVYEAAISEFGRVLGFDRLKVIHANDSKKPFGSRLDRHEHIGQGLIGGEAFRLLVNDPRLAHAPIVIETPDAETMHAVNVAALRAMVA
jgi:deoxyribonuclease-4